MLKELRFAFYAIKKNIQSSAELRTSFLMNVIGMAINNTSFVILWIFFVQSVGIIGGWTAADIIGLQGFAALAYGIVFSIAIGIRKLPDYVASGAFDRFMLSPKNLLVRVATSAFSAAAVGDIVFGVVCLTIYAVLIQASLFQILMMALLVVLASTIFLVAGLAVLWLFVSVKIFNRAIRKYESSNFMTFGN
jgi:ABC-2 type transport system permease protein